MWVSPHTPDHAHCVARAEAVGGEVLDERRDFQCRKRTSQMDFARCHLPNLPCERMQDTVSEELARAICEEEQLSELRLIAVFGRPPRAAAGVRPY